MEVEVTVRAFPTVEERDSDVRENSIVLGSATEPTTLDNLVNSTFEGHRFVGYYMNDKPLHDRELAMNAVGAYRESSGLDGSFYHEGKRLGF